MFDGILWATDGSAAADEALGLGRSLSANPEANLILLGGVTQRLLHVAPCPVLAVRAGRDGRR